MTRIKIHISNVKLPFYPPCEVKCGLQNRVSTHIGIKVAAGLKVKCPFGKKLGNENGDKGSHIIL